MKATIKTVEHLIRALDMCSGDYCVIDIMNQADIPASEFENYYTWNDNHYTRNRIAKTDKYEVLLVCWEAGQESAIHDFDSHEAWIHPICGQLREERYIQAKNSNELIKVSSVVLKKNDFSYMRDVGIHRYSNIYGARTVSLVIFSPPLKKIRVYDKESGAGTWQQIWYDKEYDLLKNQDKHISLDQNASGIGNNPPI
ncbi:MAG: cysteine dioxygenase family protein [Crocinitomicaceae bacterium]|nr:cysteine dioxygenase family protein [Crocinitomicaceae bacterium]